jgi:phosphoribosylanthranilate isomerase
VNIPFVKVCGNTTSENLKEILRAEPSHLGFILYNESPRGVTVEDCKNLLKEVPDSIKTVGVIVDLEIEALQEILKEVSFSALQLHGEQPLSFIQACKRFFKGELIQVFSIDTDFNFGICHEYEQQVDYFLFDTRGVRPGGNGLSFDWKKLNEYQGSTPFFLAGGLTFDHVQSLKELLACFPLLKGFDINSGFEISPGIKSSEQVSAFIKAFSGE